MTWLEDLEQHRQMADTEEETMYVRARKRAAQPCVYVCTRGRRPPQLPSTLAALHWSTRDPNKMTARSTSSHCRGCRSAPGQLTISPAGYGSRDLDSAAPEPQLSAATNGGCSTRSPAHNIAFLDGFPGPTPPAPSLPPPCHLLATSLPARTFYTNFKRGLDQNGASSCHFRASGALAADRN
jgi:hypothetical protein